MPVSCHIAETTARTRLHHIIGILFSVLFTLDDKGSSHCYLPFISTLHDYFRLTEATKPIQYIYQFSVIYKIHKSTNYNKNRNTDN